MPRTKGAFRRGQDVTSPLAETLPALEVTDRCRLDGYVRRAEEDDHVQFDARLSRRFRGARVFVDLTNVNGAERLDISGMPAPARAINVGLDWRWQP
jgi:hypothetical protein